MPFVRYAAGFEIVGSVFTVGLAPETPVKDNAGAVVYYFSSFFQKVKVDTLSHFVVGFTEIFLEEVVFYLVA